MKLTNVAPFALLTFAASISCSEPDPGKSNTNSGGSSGSATGGSAGMAAGATGGVGGSAGAATGGAGGTTGGAGVGGATGGAAGTMSTGGTAGSAGAGAGGVATGAGGMAGTGMAGAGMGGMAGGPIDPNTIIPGLDGLFWAIRTTNEADPGGNEYWVTDAGEDCPTNADWSMAGVSRSKTFQAVGTPGQKYTVNFELRGVMALRCYSGGTPSAMTANATAANDVFYVGGQQAGDSAWNTYELAVAPAVTGETASNYFLNGLPSTSADCDKPITYEVSYKNKFVIMGDSMLTMSTHASDCKALQNCGPDPSGADGCVARSISVEGVEVHASPFQPISDVNGDTTTYPQWLVFDIQSITTP